jgi:predicted anti-sigma-YlaC factor YlaD
MSDGHLDLLGLDAVRAGDATPEERAHSERCAQCRATIDGFRGLAARLAPARMDVPPDLTRGILAQARPRRLWRPVAAAAALLIGVGIWFASRPAIPRRLDIVDAYSLAVRLRAGQKIETAWDINHDGKVDEQDVEEIARRSVSIR